MAPFFPYLYFWLYMDKRGNREELSKILILNHPLSFFLTIFFSNKSSFDFHTFHEVNKHLTVLELKLWQL